MFDKLQSAITAFETALQTKATDNSTLDGLNQADQAAQAKLDAAIAAKTQTSAAAKTQTDQIAADSAAIADGLQAISDAALAAKEAL